jgi:hypothetical protein
MVLLVRIALFLMMVYLTFNVSLEDFKRNQIRNTWLVLGLKSVILTILVFLSVSLLNAFLGHLENSTASYVIGKIVSVFYFGVKTKVVLKFYLFYSVHVVFLILASVLLWKIKVWPAGDAKLYILLGAMLPLVSPNISYFPYTLFLAYLINIFIPPGLFYICRLFGNLFGIIFKEREIDIRISLWKGLVKKVKSKWSKIRPNFFGYVYLLVNFFILTSLSQVLRFYIYKFLSQRIGVEAILFAVLFLTWDKIVEKLMRKSTTVAFLIIFGGYLTVMALFFPDHLSQGLLDGVFMMLRFGVLLMVMKSAIKYHFESSEVYSVPVDELKPGMILSRKTLSYIKKDYQFGKECFRDDYCDGLTPSQIELLGKWFKERAEKDEKHVEVEMAKFNPFAVWVCVGAFITLFMDQDLIHLFMGKFLYFKSYLISMFSGVY